MAKVPIIPKAILDRVRVDRVNLNERIISLESDILRNKNIISRLQDELNNRKSELKELDLYLSHIKET